MRARRFVVLVLVLLTPTAWLLLDRARGAAPTAKPVSFSLFAKTGLPLGDVVWTGNRFLYVAEKTGKIKVSGPSGKGLALFASLPPEYEEMRCVPSPGEHGWAPGDLYCHGPHGEIWRVGPDGLWTTFATLPDTELQDGSSTFDTAGSFGYTLLAASGGSASQGGIVYAIEPAGEVRLVGPYPGPGGADNIELAPARFGTASNQLLFAIDGRGKGGRLLAMAPDGDVRTLAVFQYGINPIAVIGRADMPRGAARPGLYLTDTLSTNVYFAPAAQLARHAGAVFVGREKGFGVFWVVRPQGKEFGVERVRSTLDRPHGPWNFEGAVYVE